MAYKIKSKKVAKVKGRPKAEFKIRGIKGITPKGFKLHKINMKKKKVVFKRK